GCASLAAPVSCWLPGFSKITLRPGAATGAVERDGCAMAYAARSGSGWRARWSLGDGRFGSKSGFAGKRAAQQFAQEQELALRLWPRLRVEPGLSVGEWWRRWFPAQDLAPATLENYAQQYRRHVHPRF